MAIGLRDLINNHNMPDNNEREKIVYVDINEIKPSENNFYDTDDIEELAFNIACIGLNQPLTIRKLEEGYELIGGHRRRLAIIHILNSYDQEIKEKFKKVPCIIKKENSGDTEIDELKYKLMLVMDNANNRIKTDYEKMIEIRLIKKILGQLKEKDKGLFKGRLRDIAAELINISSSSAAKLESIDNNLSGELKEEFKKNKINTSQAYALSQKNKEEQEKKLEEYKKSGEMPKAEAIKKEENNDEEQEEAFPKLESESEPISEYKDSNEVQDSGKYKLSAEREQKVENNEDMHENIERQFRKYFNNFPCLYWFGNSYSSNDSYKLGFDFNFKVLINNISFFNGMVNLKSNSASTFISFKEEEILKCGVVNDEGKESYFVVKTKGENGLKSILEFRKVDENEKSK